MILLKGFKIWKRLVKFVLQLFKMKKNKMDELSSNIGQIISEGVFESMVKSYQDLHADEKSLLKFSTIGIDKLKEAMVPGTVAVRVYNAFDGNEEKFLIVPVSADGKELPIGRANELNKTSQGKAAQTDPPHCPPKC